jgi:hypothetical protein
MLPQHSGFPREFLAIFPGVAWQSFPYFVVDERITTFSTTQLRVHACAIEPHLVQNSKKLFLFRFISTFKLAASLKK